MNLRTPALLLLCLCPPAVSVAAAVKGLGLPASPIAAPPIQTGGALAENLSITLIDHALTAPDQMKIYQGSARVPSYLDLKVRWEALRVGVPAEAEVPAPERGVALRQLLNDLLVDTRRSRAQINGDVTEQARRDRIDLFQVVYAAWIASDAEARAWGRARLLDINPALDGVSVPASAHPDAAPVSRRRAAPKVPSRLGTEFEQLSGASGFVGGPRFTLEEIKRLSGADRKPWINYRAVLLVVPGPPGKPRILKGVITEWTLRRLVLSGLPPITSGDIRLMSISPDKVETVPHGEPDEG